MNGTLYQTRFGSFLFQSDIDLIKSSGSIILNSFTEIFIFEIEKFSLAKKNLGLIWMAIEINSIYSMIKP